MQIKVLALTLLAFTVSTYAVAAPDIDSDSGEAAATNCKWYGKYAVVTVGLQDHINHFFPREWSTLQRNLSPWHVSTNQGRRAVWQRSGIFPS